MTIRIERFDGVVPRRHGRLLSETQAQDATNCKLWSGKLKPFKAHSATLSSLSKTGPIETIHLFGGQYWFHWADDVDVVRVPVAGDTYERTIFTGDGVPKITDSSIATQGGPTAYPNSSQYLGVPEPATALNFDSNVSYTGDVTAATSVLGSLTAEADSGVTATSDTIGSMAVTAVGATLLISGSMALEVEGTANDNDGEMTLSIVRNSGAGDVVMKTETQSFTTRGSVLEPITKFINQDIEYTDTDPPAGSVTYKLVLTLTGGTFSVWNTLLDASVTAVGGAQLVLTTDKKAEGTVTFTGNPANNDTVTIGATTYTFKTALTGANQVLIGGTAAVSAANLIAAVNDTGVEGTNYGTGTTANASAVALAGNTTTAVRVRAITAGYAGNSIALTESSSSLAVSGSTLSGAVIGLSVGDQIVITGAAAAGMSDIDGSHTVISSGDTGAIIDVGTTQTFSGTAEWERSVVSGDGEVSVSWVYTWVATLNGLEMEGPPSPASTVLDYEDGEAVELTGFDTVPSGYGITLIRIYRANTGSDGATEFLYVGEMSSDLTSFIDEVAAEDLDEVIPSTGWLKPPTDMTGVVALPGGVIAGFSKNQLCLSEPYYFHAYPDAYKVTFPTNVVAIAAFGASLLVTTEDDPYIVTGTHPGSMNAERLEYDKACVSKRSMVDMGYVSIYASPVGLQVFGTSNADTITKDLFTRDEWDALVPSSIHAVKYDDRYMGFYDTGSEQGGFIFDPREPGATWVWLDFYATAAWQDPETGEVFLAVERSGAPTMSDIVQFDAHASSKLSYTWKSKQFVAPRLVCYAYGQVQAEAYDNGGTQDLNLKLYADGVLKHTQVVLSGEPFALPSGYRGKEWEVQVEGNVLVESVQLVASMQELERM